MPDHLPFNYNGKRVLVVGMARSGVDASRLLLRLGAVPLLNDRKDAQALGSQLDCLKGTAAEWHLGEDPVPLLGTADVLLISPGVPIDSPVVLKARELGIYTIGELEFAAQQAQGSPRDKDDPDAKTAEQILQREKEDRERRAKARRRHAAVEKDW